MSEVTSANKLFLRWLREWYQDALENNSKMRFTYKKAISSLSAYPLPVRTAKQLQELDNIGPKISKSLERKLHKHLEDGGELLDHTASTKGSRKRKNKGASEKQNVNKRGDISCDKYEKNSVEVEDKNGVESVNAEIGSFSLEVDTNTQKDEIFSPKRRNTARKSCSSVHSTVANKLHLQFKYVASDLRTPVLFRKDSLTDTDVDGTIMYLIKAKKSDLIASKVRYKMLMPSTENDDFVLAYLCCDYAEELCNHPDFCKQAVGHGSPSSLENTILHRITSDNEYKLEPGSYDICLCIDNQEISGRSHIIDFGDFFSDCEFQYMRRKLHLGDFLWIGKDKSGDKELVLDCIVERKTMHDLASSIKDSRYHEQKYRLKRCGVSRIFYVVERSAGLSEASMPESTLHQAIVNTQVVDNFKVMLTYSWKETAEFLAALTNTLKDLYKDKTLYGVANPADASFSKNILPTFEGFNKSVVKNKKMTVREAFVKLLLQVNGVSPDKASAIVNVYPTIQSLNARYDECTDNEEKMHLLANIKYGANRRNIGQAVSKSVHLFLKTVS